MTTTKTRRFPRGPRLLVLLVSVAVGGSVSTGCGDDGGTRDQAVKKPAASKKRSTRRGRGGARGGKKSESLTTYTKVEDLVSEDEAEMLRHEFKPTDFDPDPTGTVSRDPFRSYVVLQSGIGVSDSDTANLQPTPVCKKKNMVATNYSLRDLRLVGIVLRGTRSYALFRDTSSFGHIVRRGDCLGKEKARVSAIGAGFVSLEILPEVGPNQEPLPAQQRSIQLYPEELQLDEGVDGDGQEDGP